MKASILPVLFAALVGFTLLKQPAHSPANVPPPTSGSLSTSASIFAVGDRGPHHREWLRITSPEANGSAPTQTNRAYVEIATGLHYEENGQWKETEERIEPSPGGAVAQRGPHKVTFANNAVTQGAINLQTPDGHQLRSHVLGLAYFDATAGKNVIIAEVKDSPGRIVGKNQVLYEDAFSGIKADIRYTYTRAGFEQDVILREQPPLPVDFGFQPGSTRLQVLTEFVSPEPEQEQQRLQSKSGLEMADVNLDFGAMKIGRGRAFSVGESSPNAGVAVAKQWVDVDGRQVLIEEVTLTDIEPQLRVLPKSSGSLRHIVSNQRILPSPRVPSSSGGEMKIAALSAPSPGFVLDYITVNGSMGNYTFTNGTTYFVSGPVTMNTLTLQGGTVVKFTNDYGVTVAVSAVVCNTGPYCPAFFTSMDDNTVGDIINGSTGLPSPTFNPTGLTILGSSYNATLHDLRFSYLSQAIYFYPEYNSTLTLLDSQIRYCGYGVAMHGTTPAYFYAGNVLMDWLSIGVYSDRILNVTLDYVTADNVTQLAYATLNDYSGLTVSNSVISRVTAIGNPGLAVTAGNNGLYLAPQFGDPIHQANASPFQTAGLAAHYLTNDCPFLGMGLATTNSAVTAGLRQRTTIAPLLLPGTLDVNTTLTARSLGDTGAPDLGYHYDVLDYLAATNTVTNATVTLDGGVAVGVWGKGFVLANGAVINSQGTPHLPNRIENSLQVMEIDGWSLPQDSSGAAISPITLGTMPVPLLANFRFTRFGTPAAAYSHMNGGGPGSYFYNDCQFSGGVFHNGFGPGNGTGITISVTNCLFEQVAVVMTGRLPATTRFYNNLFRNGALNITRQSSTTVNIFDNMIEAATIFQSGPPITANYNGYINGKPRLTPNGANDRLITNADFQTGPLGFYYYPASGGNLSTLINTGSRTVTAAGLTNHTTQTNLLPDSGTVDIGYHSVATPDNGSAGMEYLFPISDTKVANMSLFEPITLAISSKEATVGTVAVPGLGIVKTFSTTPGTVTQVGLPFNVTVFNHNVVENLGIHVTAQKPVGVQVVSVSDFGASVGFLAFPTSMIGTNYCIMSRRGTLVSGAPAYSVFAVTATTDNTTVTITPSPTAGIAGHPGTNSFTVKLHQGQTYQPTSDANVSTNDVTGTFVTSDKPVAVVAGSAGSHLPAGFGQAQPLMEQQLPVNSWGGWALGFPFGGRTGGDFYRVLAAYDNTAVTINGNQIVTLQRGQFFEAMTNGPIAVYGSKPIQVAHFATGSGFDGMLGDPTETILSSPGQYVTNCTFFSSDFFNNHLTLIVPQSAISTTFVDGVAASSLMSFTPIGSSGYSGGQTTVVAGSHNVTSSQPVGVEVYGWGSADAYGFIGARSTPLLAAAPDFTNVLANSTNTIDVLANDTYSNLSSVVVTILTNPSHGSVSINNKRAVYSTTGYTGIDQFTYRIAENGRVSNAVVTVWIGNHAPVASNDVVCAVTTSPIVISVLANDNDVDGDTLNIVFASAATNGIVTVNPNKTITYDSLGAANVHDSFTYTITDSKGGGATGRVYINPAVAVEDSFFAANVGSTPLPVLLNDVDLMDRPLTIIAVTQGTLGQTVIAPGSTSLNYTPNPNVTVPDTDTITYTITDGLCTNTASVSIIVFASDNVVSVQLNGPPDIYKGLTGLGIPYGGYTWFDLTRTGQTNSSLFMTFFLGGDGTAFPSFDPCFAVHPDDFAASGCNSAPFPNGFSVIIPAGQSQVTIGVDTVDNPSDCEESYQTLLFTIPEGGSGYTRDPNAFQATANIYPYY